MAVKSVHWMLKIIWMILAGKCSGQQVAVPRQVCQLPAVITESSGLTIPTENRFFSHNDSGSEPVLFQFDSTGSLLKSDTIPWALNTDWEDLAFDRNTGVHYIGDFGNNGNNRTDLRIYKLRMIDSVNWQNLGTISYTYPDQTSFPASANFDMEGFIFFQDSLYLFSKNKFPGGNGFSKIYALPADTGHYVARLIDSIYTATPITAADISPDGKTLALLSYTKLILFHQFDGVDFLSGSRHDVGIPLSQTEAVAFAPDGALYFTNEAGYLFALDIAPILSGLAFTWQDELFSGLYPNPAHRFVSISNTIGILNELALFDMNGREVFSAKNLSSREIEIPELPGGIYLYTILIDQKKWKGKILIR